MTFNAAGKRTWSPKGRPKSHARHNGYSHAEGGVATSYPAFGAFMGRVNCGFEGFVVICCVSHCVAGFRGADHGARNAGSQRRERRLPVRFRRRAHHAFQRSLSLPFNRCRRARRSRSRATTRQAPAAVHAGPTQCRAASGFFPLASPSPQGRGPLDPAQPIPLADTRVAHAGDPIFVRVVDLDRNRDGNVVETVDVRVAVAATGDAEVLRLSETGPNTGVFVGYIATTREHRQRRLRARGRAQRRARGDLRRSDRQHRRGAGRRAGRSVRSGVRLADRRADQWRARAPRRCDHGSARHDLRRRRCEPLSRRNGDWPDGDRPGRHAVQHAGGCVPLPAGRSGQLPSRSAAAWQLRVPLAAHDRRSADAAERAVPPAAGFLRPALRRHRGSGRRGRHTARLRPQTRCCCARPRVSRSLPPATSCSTR